MSENKLFRPKAYPIRKPTETSKAHGAILNPPRMMEIGGASSLSKAHYKNDKSLKKPGGTR